MNKGKRSEPKRVGQPRKKENKEKRNRITPVGKTVIVLMTVLTVVFSVVLAMARLLPAKFLIPIYAVLLLMLAIIALLVKNHKKKTRFVVGLIFSAVMTLVLAVGGFTLSRGIQALNAITNGEVEMDYISVYVRADDPAQEMADTLEYTYGILKSMDRHVTDQAIEKLNKELKEEIAVQELRSIPNLLDALLDGDADAILFPEAYFSLLSDLPGYENVASKIRALATLEFKGENKDEGKKINSEDTFTVFISGIDTWGGIGAKSRSDVNILATVNTETKQVLLVSTPRDYYVPLSISDGIPDKLTHAGIYGVDVSMDTIGMIYDIDVDYFFRVNFSGFEEIIDSLGGITVYSECEFGRDGYYFSVGENHMYGEAALVFARERYSFQDGDRQRGRNQMAVIQAVINKALSPELLKSYSSVLEAVEGNFETSVPYNKIASVVRDQLDKGGDWNIVSYSVNGTGDTQIPYSLSVPAYVMIPDQSTVDTAKELMRQVREGEVITMP